MEDNTLAKIYQNQIVSNIKQKNPTPIEMARLIDEYLKLQVSRGVPLVQIEKELGVTKRVLYKYRSLLKVPKEIVEKYEDTLSFEQMSIVSYSIKDKERLAEVLEQTAQEDIPSNQLVYRVAEINDRSKIFKHIIGEVKRSQLWAIGLRERVLKLPADEQKEVRENVEDLITKLDGV